MFYSIVIPMYNVEHYIERCLQSVFDQDYPELKYEILLINDGSPDNSKKIAEEYSRGRKNVKIITQENRGLGGARNTGIEQSRGDYVIFLDSDDILYPHALSEINRLLVVDEINILELSSSLVNTKLELLSTFCAENLGNITTGVNYYLHNKSIPSACNKIYSITFLNDYNLRFQENIYIEDFEFNTRSFFYAKRVRSQNILLQKFVQTSDSITRNENKEIKKKLTNDIFKITGLVNFFKNQQKSLSAIEELFFNERLSRLNVNFIYQCYKYGFSSQEIFLNIKKLKSENLYFLKYPIMDKNKNIFRILIHRFPILFRVIIKFK